MAAAGSHIANIGNFTHKVIGLAMGCNRWAEVHGVTTFIGVEGGNFGFINEIFFVVGLWGFDFLVIIFGLAAAECIDLLKR